MRSRPLPFPAFYQPSHPPAVIPLLLSQMDLAPQPTSIVLLSMQELPPPKLKNDRAAVIRMADSDDDDNDDDGSGGSGDSRVRPHPRRSVPPAKSCVRGPARSARASTTARVAPYKRPPKKVVIQERCTPFESEESSLSELESESDIGPAGSTKAEDRPIGQIPKPLGEAGRPGRGGYTLVDRLSCTPEEFKRMKIRVEDIAVKYLDMDKCFSKQNAEKLNIVRDEAVEEFPSLARYEQFWPVDDMIKAILKYRVSRTKLPRTRSQVGKDV